MSVLLITKLYLIIILKYSLLLLYLNISKNLFFNPNSYASYLLPHLGLQRYKKFSIFKQKTVFLLYFYF